MENICLLDLDILVLLNFSSQENIFQENVFKQKRELVKGFWWGFFWFLFLGFFWGFFHLDCLFFSGTSIDGHLKKLFSEKELTPNILNSGSCC